MQDLIVFRQRGHEDDAVDVAEEVDPLPPFGLLTADVVHEEEDAPVLEAELHHAGSLRSRPQNVLFEGLND